MYLTCKNASFHGRALLANIALGVIDEHVDAKWAAHGGSDGRRAHRKRGGTTYRLVRYADDLAVLVFGTREQAEALRDDVADVAARLRTLFVVNGVPFRDRNTSVSGGSPAELMAQWWAKDDDLRLAGEIVIGPEATAQEIVDRLLKAHLGLVPAGVANAEEDRCSSNDSDRDRLGRYGRGMPLVRIEISVDGRDEARRIMARFADGKDGPGHRAGSPRHCLEARPYAARPVWLGMTNGASSEPHVRRRRDARNQTAPLPG
jgi:hypothetical protein